MMALSIENCNLHRRMALAVLKLVGAKKKWLGNAYIYTLYDTIEINAYYLYF